MGILVYGTVASATQREDSDLDVFLVYQEFEPTPGIQDVELEGIKVGKTFFTYEILAQNADSVPYLLHPVAAATLLLDRHGTIKPVIDRLKAYFESNPQVEQDWRRIYDRLKQEKQQFGCERTTILDVWNALEARYSGGELKRTFFSQFG